MYHPGKGTQLCPFGLLSPRTINLVVSFEWGRETLECTFGGMGVGILSEKMLKYSFSPSRQDFPSSVLNLNAGGLHVHLYSKFGSEIQF